MAALPRLTSASVASAAAVGLVVSLVPAPPAAAAPCVQTTSAEAKDVPQPPHATWSAPVDREPIGRKPAGAVQDQAPPPALGLLPAADPDPPEPSTPNSAPMEEQAAVIPAPTPPGGGDQPAPESAKPPNPAPKAAAPPGPKAPDRATGPIGPTKVVGWLTGPNSRNHTWPRFGISGADLGVIWDNGQTGGNDQVLMAFGDTYGDCTVPGQQWRRNTLFRSTDHNLSDGVTVPDPAFGNIYGGSPVADDHPNFSRQIIDSLDLEPTEASVIPTAGVSVGTTQYVNFMSVKQWGNPGQWTTNFSAIAVSTDNGETWTVDRSTIRASSGESAPEVPYVSGNQHFQQGAFLRRGGYMYSFGTPSGRGGSAYVSRVPEKAVLDLTKYEYWHQPWLKPGPGSWARNDPSAATAVISAPVSEMSVQYNDYLKKYIVLYTNFFNSVVMRTADNPQGPWSSARTLVRSVQVPGGIYAPFIHPWSAGRDLYFNLSLWSSYSVMLMHATLP